MSAVEETAELIAGYVLGTRIGNALRRRRRLPDDVAEYFEILTADTPLEQLRHERDQWKNSADLNEELLAEVRYFAGLARAKYDGWDGR